MIFLTVDDVEVLHYAAIEAFGGSHGVRDRSSLASAVMRAQSGSGNTYFYEFPYGMAASYAFAIAKNHPFIDGNKRTAAAAMGAFLGVNRIELQCTDRDLEGAMLAVATGQLTCDALAEWIRVSSRARGWKG